MKRKRFSDEQIIAILRLHQAGAKSADLRNQPRISETTLYNWRSRYGGLQVLDFSLSGLWMIPELEAIIAVRGKPATIVSDNGTALTNNAVLR
ncbi:transposase [Reyranella massiliensis]|uniref:transposase n=1 Tax=Reyranella massiliensis TaxID=445220 RepID=UPI0002E7981F|nr:transposase [Reyranella massiliensis]